MCEKLASQGAQWKRIHLPMQDTQEPWVPSLVQEDPMKKEIATHSSILAWKILWTEEPGRLQSPWGCKELDTTEQLSMHTMHIYKWMRKKDKEKKKCFKIQLV